MHYEDARNANVIDRINALDDLIKLRVPMEIALANLGKFGWDYDRDLVLITREDLIRLLRAYIQGDIGTRQVNEWANSLEAREDVGFEQPNNDLLSNILFQLANPDLTSNLTVASAAELMRELEQSN